MNKPLVLVSGPVETRSGYGNHARDICRALIELDKYDVMINSVPWGSTPMNALEGDNKHHQEIKNRILNSNELPKQPDLHFHIVIPNEFQPIAKKNIGITAGIEATIPAPKWIDGVNRMDLTICTSEFTKSVFENAEFTKKTPDGSEAIHKIQKPMETLFEGFEEIYKATTEIDDEVNDVFESVKEDFGFLYTGHWLQGGLGQDRKDTGMLVKVFCETFKNQKNPPALMMKTSGATFSIIDRNEILDKIKDIKDSIRADSLPNVYLIHGNFTDEQMNQMYNHPKVHAHVSFTHGEGFGRPLLEAAQSGKPIMASNWSGHLDFLHGSYCSLIPGSLTKVPKGAFPKELFFEESQWFTVNYQVASQLLKDIYNNYKKYKVKAQQLKVYTQAFSFEKMKERLDELIEPLIDAVPKQVTLNLPKLNKIKKK
jgi:glycosyltransferase involved in cell wall biosynthesis